jgi:Zn-dependent M28 family amino/carboxypeptidase
MPPSFALLLAAAAAAASPIQADRIAADVRMLSSDAFAGRGPGEVGDARTTDYLADRFRAAGLEPGGENGGWFQEVPLVRLDRQPGARLTLATPDGRTQLPLGRQATLGLGSESHTVLTDAPIMFAGFGVVDPALGYDPYAGVDMTGRIALVLANDPDFEADRDLGFGGRALVYGGRFGAKVAAAAKAGAIGVFVIHEDAAASYPFSQLASGDALPGMAPAPFGTSPVKATGWLDRSAWEPLLRAHGLDLQALKVQARDPKFRARPLPGTALSVDATLKTTPVVSRNVVAILRGSKRPDEYVLYGAHWDANGTNGPDATGDAIRNGAIDNATGTAELLEVARAFAAGPRPARSIVFAAWTAEEKGLLGAEYFAAHPLYPLARTAAVINLDPHIVLPAGRNLELIGGGQTPLEAEVARLAAARGLRLDPEPLPEAGWYFRSDHYPFARRGVPTAPFRAGRDLVEGGLVRGTGLVAAYNARCYHQPCDQFDPNWTFAGTAQEATVAFDLGREIGNAATWPGWHPGHPAAAIRAESAAERGR